MGTQVIPCAGVGQVFGKLSGQVFGNNWSSHWEFSVNVDVSVEGVTLTGTTVAGTYIGNGVENYTYSSNLGATAVTVSKSGTWNNTFSATAISTGVGDALAVSVTGEGSTGNWKAPAKGSATFTANAQSSKLSQAATAVSVDSNGTLVIGENLGINISSTLSTAGGNGTNPIDTAKNFTATGIAFASTTAEGFIGASEAITADSLNGAAISIVSSLSVTDPGDLVTAGEQKNPMTATAYSINQTGSKALNVLAGSVAGNIISAAVTQSNGALTQGAAANAYAVTASGQGALNITLANPEKGTSSATLEISANNDAFFATTAPATSTARAAAIFADGSQAASVINVDAQSGTIDINATAAGQKGSQAYGVLTTAGTTGNGTVALKGKTMSISATGGAEDAYFATPTTPTGDQWTFVDNGPVVNTAAIFVNNAVASDAAPTTASVFTSGVQTLNVDGNVVALGNKSTAGTATLTITGVGQGAEASNVSTTTTVSGDLYAIAGGYVEIGSTKADGKTSDSIIVTGDTYVVGGVDIASANSVSTLTVLNYASYTAQGQTVVANGGALTVTGTYNAQGAVIISNQTPIENNATANAIITVGSGTAGGTMTANSTTTLTQGGVLDLQGATGEGKTGIYTALGDMTIGDAPTTLTGIKNSGKVSIGQYGQLNIGNDAGAAVTATVNLGGSITSAASGNMKVFSGATLALVTAPTEATYDVGNTNKQRISGVQSTIEGTVQILGSNLPAATTEVAPSPVFYAGGLGDMTIEDGGSVIGDEGGLYLELIEKDELTFSGGTMTANQVNVGTSDGATTGATLTIEKDGKVTVGQLAVGGTTGKGTVTVSDGILELDGPTTVGDVTTSNLTVTTNGTFTVEQNGVLVTNSLNLWNEEATEKPTDLQLSGWQGGGRLGTNVKFDGGFIELTDATVDADWLQAANALEDFDSAIIVENTLTQNGKKVNSVLPFAPQNTEKPVTGLNYQSLMPNGGVLPAALNATTQDFKNADGKTTTTYQNLVVGDTTQGKLWEQTNKLWTIQVEGNIKTVGFSSIQIGKGDQGGNILVTGDYNLVLTGTGAGQAIVSGEGNNIYIGTSTSSGTLTLGSLKDTGIAKGGTYTGTITATNGNVNVQYADYVVDGEVILGDAPTGNAIVGANTGNISVQDGSLTV